METVDKYLPHLLELRQRILRSFLVFIVVLIPLLIFSSELFSLLAQPILKTLPQGGMLIATEVITPFTAPMKLAIFTALIALIPYFLYQGWAFVKPGLYRNEKRTLLPIILLSTALFYTGMVFAHLFVCPLALSFFMAIAPKGVTVMTDMSHYLDFILVMYFAFGGAFQVPIITFLLIHFGITSVEALKKHRPYIIVAAFIIGMLLTPPDVISQILLAVPLLGLFEGGLLLAKWFAKDPKTQTSLTH